jgi:hypothetical protein
VFQAVNCRLHSLGLPFHIHLSLFYLLGYVWFYSNPYRLRGIEDVSILSKSKYLPIHINLFQSIWIENNRMKLLGIGLR